MSPTAGLQNVSYVGRNHGPFPQTSWRDCSVVHIAFFVADSRNLSRYICVFARCFQLHTPLPERPMTFIEHGTYDTETLLVV
jgi:hypothetical protein